MAAKTFYSELAVEPLGFVGHDTSSNEDIVVYPSIHASLSTLEVISLKAPLASKKSFHRLFSTSIGVALKAVIPGSAIIHKSFVEEVILGLRFVPYTSIHKNNFLDKWNARFTQDCLRYIDTPKRSRYLDTPGCSKYLKPSEGYSYAVPPVIFEGPQRNGITSFNELLLIAFDNLTLIAFEGAILPPLPTDTRNRLVSSDDLAFISSDGFRFISAD